MEVEHLQLLRQMRVRGQFQAIQQLNGVEAEFGGFSARLFPLSRSSGKNPDSDAQCGSHLHGIRDLQDLLQIRHLLHDNHRVLADLGGYHDPLQVPAVLDSIAHEKRARMHLQGEGRRQFGLGPHLQSVFVSVTRFQKPFHDAALLIHLHREYSAVARSIVILGYRIAEGLVELFDLCVEDLREAQQIGGPHLPLGQRLQQSDELHSHQWIACGMHGEAALFAHAEVTRTPILHAVDAMRNLAWRHPKNLGQLFHLSFLLDRLL